ncbi:MAG: portal protein [Phenylobacterium sp.]
MTDETQDETVMARARADFARAREAMRQDRDAAAEDLRFARLGEQWPEAIRRARELEGRPCLTLNRLPTFIRQVVNEARQNRPAITCHPVDSAADPGTAEVLNGLIRNIEQSSDADVAYDTALDFAVTCGFGVFRINARASETGGEDLDLAIERVADPFSVWGDPDSLAADSSDWDVAFVTREMGLGAFRARWPDAEPVDWSMEDDVPGEAARLGGEGGRRVRIVEAWRREAVERTLITLSDGQEMEAGVFEARRPYLEASGLVQVGAPRKVPGLKVVQRILSGAAVLETVDWPGRYIPLVPVYGEEIRVDGRRRLRGLVRDARDAQRMFNYWRTTSTELVALAPKAPFIGRKGAFDTDQAQWTTANSQTHAFIEYDGPEPPQRQPFAGVPAGALQEALNAADDLKSIMGLHDASLGARSNETSGKAILARQREGDVSTFHYIDNLSRAIRHAGRILIDLIPKVYSTQRMVRILGPDGVPALAAVNGAAVNGAEGGGGRVFDLGAGRYDLTVRAGPSFASRREEAASQMIELIRAFPPAAPLIGDLLAKNLDWPGADEVARRLARANGGG